MQKKKLFCKIRPQRQRVVGVESVPGCEDFLNKI
jgi:hypothetical protein